MELLDGTANFQVSSMEMYAGDRIHNRSQISCDVRGLEVLEQQDNFSHWMIVALCCRCQDLMSSLTMELYANGQHHEGLPLHTLVGWQLHGWIRDAYNWIFIFRRHLLLN